MSEAVIVELLLMWVRTVALLAGPFMVTVVVVAVLSNVLQTVTQIKDPALAFVPKVIAAIVVLVLAAPWLLQVLESFTRGILELLAEGTM
jgi:flagellar biosynthetic protein FliQ